MEDLEQYLEEIVAPTVVDFEANPASRRHAFMACVVIAHAVDYLEYPKSARGRRNEFKVQSADFRSVDLIAHAFKHVETDGRTRLKASQVITRPPGRMDQAAWDLSRWDDATGGVTIDENVELDVLATAKRAVAFLYEIVERGGVS